VVKGHRKQLPSEVEVAVEDAQIQAEPTESACQLQALNSDRTNKKAMVAQIKRILVELMV
jgi:hypothetical protein